MTVLVSLVLVALLVFMVLAFSGSPKSTAPENQVSDPQPQGWHVPPEAPAASTSDKWKIVIAGFVFLAIVGSFVGDGDTSGPSRAERVNPSDQDHQCHRLALAMASNSVDDFEWNGYGMSTYHSEYDACLKLMAAISD